tara:strand:- start:1488 stop:2102 length:615 start_codon:yes stop_codon:yes gene_type:complete
MSDKKVLIELFIDDKDQDNALDIISFVSAPAIESDFMSFKEAKEGFAFKATDEDKRIVTGAAMMPNKEIVRMDAEDKPYFVYFTEETIEKCQEIFAKYGKTKSTNFEHSTGMRDVTVVESWIVTDPANDKSNALGFSDIPKGSWFVSYKIDNDELWAKVKSGDVKGFSIEGVFSKNIVEMSKDDSDNTDNKLDNIFGKIYDLLD